MGANHFIDPGTDAVADFHIFWGIPTPYALLL
jgi:hypothetical protein